MQHNWNAEDQPVFDTDLRATADKALTFITARLAYFNKQFAEVGVPEGVGSPYAIRF